LRDLGRLAAVQNVVQNVVHSEEEWTTKSNAKSNIVPFARSRMSVEVTADGSSLTVDDSSDSEARGGQQR
jgi:hypothetical protein